MRRGPRRRRDAGIGVGGRERRIHHAGGVTARFTWSCSRGLSCAFVCPAHRADLIREVTIERFRAIEAAHELRASITLRDGSVLHVRDYVFRDGTRKYAYHWQSRRGRL